MKPEENWPPIRKAFAVIVDLPELLTLDKAATTGLETRINQIPAFASVWEYISTHPMAASADAAVAAMTRVTRRIEPDRELSRIPARRRQAFEALRDKLSSAWGLLGQNQ
jgi:hypothetical protein